MKARQLKALLNDTGYAITNHADYIAVGSPLCHDLISVNKKTMKIKLTLDTFNKGRPSLGSGELVFIYDKIVELIENGTMCDIILGRDFIENPLPVFYFTDSDIIETATDAYGWPNVDQDGNQMYDNTYFKTRGEAINKAIEEMGYAADNYKRIISENQKYINKIKELLLDCEANSERFKHMLSD